MCSISAYATATGYKGGTGSSPFLYLAFSMCVFFSLGLISGPLGRRSWKGTRIGQHVKLIAGISANEALSRFPGKEALLFGNLPGTDDFPPFCTDCGPAWAPRVPCWPCHGLSHPSSQVPTGNRLIDFSSRLGGIKSRARVSSGPEAWICNVTYSTFPSLENCLYLCRHLVLADPRDR